MLQVYFCVIWWIVKWLARLQQMLRIAEFQYQIQDDRKTRRGTSDILPARSHQMVQSPQIPKTGGQNGHKWGMKRVGWADIWMIFFREEDCYSRVFHPQHF